jgi:hypothetical protein
MRSETEYYRVGYIPFRFLRVFFFLFLFFFFFFSSPSPPGIFMIAAVSRGRWRKRRSRGGKGRYSMRGAARHVSLSLSAPRSCLTLSPEDYYFQRIGISSRPTATIRALLFFEEDGLEEKPARLARPPPPAIAGMLHPSFDLAGRGRGEGRLFGARARSYTLVGPRRDERETVADLSAVTPRPQPQCTRRALRRGRANGGKMIHSS